MGKILEFIFALIITGVGIVAAVELTSLPIDTILLIFILVRLIQIATFKLDKSQ